MATMTYRCPVDPEGCGDRPARGYCDRHAGAVLEVVRATMAPAPPAAAPAAPAPPAQDRPQVALELLDRRVQVPPGGLVLGREVPPLEGLPGMAELTQVSRTHARLLWLADHLYVEDCTSTNGTFVDGEKVTTRRRLTPGQRLRLGLDVDVRVVAVDVDEFGLPR
jgi:hypothetical protein